MAEDDAESEGEDLEAIIADAERVLYPCTITPTRYSGIYEGGRRCASARSTYPTAHSAVIRKLMSGGSELRPRGLGLAGARTRPFEIWFNDGHYSAVGRAIAGPPCRLGRGGSGVRRHAQER